MRILNEEDFKLLGQKIEKLQEENELLRECVEFYADKARWNSQHDTPKLQNKIFIDDLEGAGIISGIGGKRARECLAKLGER